MKTILKTSPMAPLPPRLWHDISCPSWHTHGLHRCLILSGWCEHHPGQHGRPTPPLQCFWPTNPGYQYSLGRQNHRLLLQRPTSSSSCPSERKRTPPLQQIKNQELDLQQWMALLQGSSLCPQTSSPWSGHHHPQFLQRWPWQSSSHHYPPFQGLLMAWPFHLCPEICFRMCSLPSAQGSHPSYGPSHHTPCLWGLLSLPKPLCGPHHQPSPSQWPQLSWSWLIMALVRG